MGRMEVIMLKLKFFFILFCLLASGPTSGDMDWETYTLKASATDQTAAYDLLKKEFANLQYDHGMLVKDFLQTNTQLNDKVFDLLAEYRILTQNYLTDGSTEYVYNLSLTNKIMLYILPKISPVKLVVPMLCPYCNQEWPAGKTVPPDIKLVPKQIETTEYTGIIIDCRGLNLRPCFFPRIYNDALEEVYSVNFADQNFIIDQGLVLYTMQDPYNDPRIGQNALRIRATDVIGSSRTDIKVSGSDGQRIHGSKNNLNLLRECRLAIIFGP
jgi:hypothetical protein